MDRIEEILDFFKSEDIVHEGLTVCFEDCYSDCCFLPCEMEIYLSPKYFEEQRKKELGTEEKFTCQNDQALIEFFTPLEICFFHELGHYCDLHYKFDFNMSIFEKEAVMFNEFIDEAVSIVEDEFDKFYNKLMVLYRSLGIEKRADENAYMLMKYFIEKRGAQ